MGQKVHPIGFRLGSYRKWDSVWFARKDFASLVLEDRRIRDFIKKDRELKGSGIAGVDIKRAASKLTIKIHTSRPGMVIGQKGKKIEDLRRRLEKMVGRELVIDVQEVRKPEINAQLVAENIAQQLERRVSFRRAMKKVGGPGLEVRGQGHQDPLQGPAGRGGNRPAGDGTGKAGCRCIPCGPLLITALPRPRPPTGIIGVKTWIFHGELLGTEESMSF